MNLIRKIYDKLRRKPLLVKPVVCGSFKHSILDVWKFSEWIGTNYVRLHECWVHRYSDQRNKDNYKNTGELWKLWWENYR
jgi:hypothetical protein